MTRTISQRELRNESAKVIRELQAGETFIITNNGEPVGELRPLRRPERTVNREALIRALDQVPPLPAGTHGRMRAEHDAIADGAVVDPYTGEEL